MGTPEEIFNESIELETKLCEIISEFESKHHATVLRIGISQRYKESFDKETEANFIYIKYIL